MRKSFKIAKNLKLNFSNSGVSTTIGSKGTSFNKKLASFDDDNKENSDNTNSLGFPWFGFFLAIFGLGFAFNADVSWIAITIAAIFGVAGVIIVISSTILNPKWLWILPLISAIALYKSEMDWWLTTIHIVILAIGTLILVCKIFVKEEKVIQKQKNPMH